MAENTGVHIVEIRAGNSQRPVLELRPGVVVQPMSIGRVGMWSVDAPGVLDVHAYIYFDGRSLFLQSADAANPARGNGQAIGSAWQQIEIPCTIEVGRARLVYRALDEIDEDGEEDKTIAQPIQVPTRAQAAQFAQSSGPVSNRKGPDSDATRLGPLPAREPDPTVVSPLEMGLTPMGGVPKARPAAGMPAWDASPNSSPTQIGAPPQAPAPPPPQNTGYQAFGSVQVAVPAPPPAPQPGMMMGGNPMGQTLQAPMQSPLMQPQMQMQMQPGMQPMMQQMQPQMQMQPGMQPMMQQQMQPGMQQPMMYPPGGPMMGPGPGPSAETGRIQTPGDGSAWQKAVAEWKAMPPLRKFIIGTFPGVALLVYFMLFDTPIQRPRQQVVPTATASQSASATPSSTSTAAPTTSASDVAMPTTTASGTNAVPTATVTATATTTAPTVTASATAKPPHDPKAKKSVEREAIELVGQGQYAKAAALYDQLAQEHPEQPAYREAARLLHLRANGN
ncbi:MAG TPA: FHA domain-containing protein [Polyangiaceae bacterium]